jgi:hypothetical protein
MQRVCVFCGERPVGKTSEHVLPQWVIELTGDANRVAEFGYDHLENGAVARRSFAYDSLKFPACQSCNQTYSALEAATKPVVQKMLSESALSVRDLSTLLDWLDKVRVGLWLGFLYLDRNPMAAEPHYFVGNRIGQHDRMLAIFRSERERSQGFSFIGCDTPLFAITPCCFCLRINHLWFLNISYMNLLSRRLGFPYPSETFLLEDDGVFSYFRRGRNRIMRPVLKKTLSLHGTVLYQPMFMGNVRGKLNGKMERELYDTEYVRNNCLSWDDGVGNVFIDEHAGVKAYSARPSLNWIPGKVYRPEDMLVEIQQMTFDWQLYLDSLRPSLKLVSREKKGAVIKKRSVGVWYNKEMLQLLRTVTKEIETSPLIIERG